MSWSRITSDNIRGRSGSGCRAMGLVSSKGSGRILVVEKGAPGQLGEQICHHGRVVRRARWGGRRGLHAVQRDVGAARSPWQAPRLDARATRRPPHPRRRRPPGRRRTRRPTAPRLLPHLAEPVPNPSARPGSGLEYAAPSWPPRISRNTRLASQLRRDTSIAPWLRDRSRGVVVCS